MQIASLFQTLAVVLSLSGLAACNNTNKDTTTTTNNAANEWQTIFNGKDLSGWRVKLNHHQLNDNYANTFRVEEGIIKVRYDGYDEFNQRFGHLYYDQPLTNFHLKFDYRFTGTFLQSAPSYAYRNSGVMFHSQAPETINQEQNWPISIEFQLLAEKTPGEPRPTGNMCSPGTDIYYQGMLYPEHCLLSASQTYPLNEWVTAELIVDDGAIKHIINGITVMEYSVAFARQDNLVVGATAEIWEQMVDLRSGYIAFQSEGQPVDFRNIQLKALD